jgi:hypothetical protein
MPLPADLHTVTVTGSYFELDGSPMSGTISFAAPGILTSVADNLAIQGSVTAELVNGTFIVTLVATDNTAIQPAGWVYQITENLVGQALRSYKTPLATTMPQPINLLRLAPLT